MTDYPYDFGTGYKAQTVFANKTDAGIYGDIRKNGSNGTPFKELQQVLPGHSRGQIQTLLRELRAARRISCAGSTSAAKWYPAETSEK